MTSSVTVKAHCGSDKQVRVIVTTENTGTTILLEDGETYERYVYDDILVSACEIHKLELVPIEADRNG